MTKKSWDFEPNTSSGGGAERETNYTKFPVGITRVRILDDTPLIRWQHWLPKLNRGVTCAGKGCPICEIIKQQRANKETPNYNNSKRISVNIYNQEMERFEILEQGVTFFTDVKDLMLELSEKEIALQDIDLKVKRRGSGKEDTSYRIDLGDQEPLPTAVANKVEENKVDLEDFYKTPTPEQLTRILNGEDFAEVFKREEAEEHEVK